MPCKCVWQQICLLACPMNGHTYIGGMKDSPLSGRSNMLDCGWYTRCASIEIVATHSVGGPDAIWAPSIYLQLCQQECGWTVPSCWGAVYPKGAKGPDWVARCHGTAVFDAEMNFVDKNNYFDKKVVNPKLKNIYAFPEFLRGMKPNLSTKMFHK